jgi:phosphatidylglycerol:prolipoprotein diacylglycerol transferase
MHPILIQLGKLPIHTFGVLMGAAFLAGILISMRNARMWGLDPEEIFNLSFWIMLSGIGGARLVYIIIDLLQKGADSEFLTRPIAWLAIWEGGLVWYGGFIGATLTVLWYARRFQMPVWRVCDALAPATFIGLAIGRIGCLMAGDDFGRPTTVPWGIVFRNPEALVYPDSLRGVPLHPTQIYMEAKSFSIGVFLMWFLRKRKSFDGQMLALALLVYPPLRAIVEIYRGDFQRGYWIPGVLSTSQGIGLVMVIVGVAFWIWRRRRAPEMKAAAPAALPESRTA